MSRQSSYFKTGVFILAAGALAVTGLIFFGRTFFEDDAILVETYLDETVQGLDRGSAVRMRGVQIGRVDRITFVRNEYPEAMDSEGKPVRYILIRMAIRPGPLLPFDGTDLRDILEREVANGLRVRLTSQGLTGLTYLELDYGSPDSLAPISVTWTPKLTHLPSALSTKARMTETADEVMGSLRAADIDQTVINMNEFLVSLTAMLEGLDITELQREVVGLVGEVRKTNVEVLTLLQSSSMHALTSETLAVARSARRLTERMDARSDQMLGNFERLSGDLASVTARIDALLGSQEVGDTTRNLAATSDALRTAAESLPETMESLNNALLRVERLIWSEQANMEAVMENLRRISQNLAELSEEAKRNPSGVFFGEAPARSGPPGGRP
jgi:ABC-type transporter Mla subunit MlaD